MFNLRSRFSHVLNDRIIRQIRGRSRVLPDFIIFGTVRSGTTSLYYNICNHPCIEPADYDEIGFFDSNFELGINWYKSHFPTINKKNIILKKEKYFATGEDTPFYFWNEDVINRILKLIPNVRLIAILRNPVDRTYSNYHLARRQKDEESSFEDVIKKEKAFIEKELKIGENISFEKEVDIWPFMSRSIYVEQLKKWYKKFPSEQIHIISTEDFLKEPDATLKNIFEFLNVPNKEISNLEKKKVAKYDKMKDETRKDLLDFFKPYNEQLFDLIGKRFQWEN